jgi:beta-phosphoglucomutase-like phosphatase (HAD superfamily)
MSDVDGEYAFDIILDQLIDTRVELKTAQAEARDAASKVRDSESLVATAQRATAALKAEQDKALPALKELWEAAEALASLVIRDGAPSMNIEAVRVNKALADARDHCDQMPF